MSDNKADEYLRNAQACMEVAERIGDPGQMAAPLICGLRVLVSRSS